MPSHPKVLIVSEGFGHDTRIVLDDEDGTPIARVMGADIRIRTEELVEVELQVMMPVLSVKGSVREIQYSCPICSHVMEHRCEVPQTLGGTC
jgi:hypothetical protein